jgi:hypothetical protein
MEELNIKLMKAMKEFKLLEELQTFSNKDIIKCYREISQCKKVTFNDELRYQIFVPLTSIMVTRFLQENEEKE